jgi:hypothetical protein
MRKTIQELLTRAAGVQGLQDAGIYQVMLDLETELRVLRNPFSSRLGRLGQKRRELREKADRASSIAEAEYMMLLDEISGLDLEIQDFNEELTMLEAEFNRLNTFIIEERRRLDAETAERAGHVREEEERREIQC